MSIPDLPRSVLWADIAGALARRLPPAVAIIAVVYIVLVLLLG